MRLDRLPRRSVFSWVVLVVCALLCLGGLLTRTPAADAQTGPVGSAVAYAAGWNLISFADSTGFTQNPALVGPLYTLNANGSYVTSDLQHVTTGVGYWAYLSDVATFTLLPSRQSGINVSIAPGRCSLIGNPSTGGPATVTGADRVLAFSAVEYSYIAETRIGIGRGALACNDSAASEQVSIVDTGSVIPLDWPSCCQPSANPHGGSALLVIENDSPYPLTLAAPPIDGQGNQINNGILAHAVLDACAGCPEYDPGMHSQCAAAAETRSVVVPAGRYLLHIESDGPNVPDVQGMIDVAPDTSYDICFFVTTGRPG